MVEKDTQKIPPVDTRPPKQHDSVEQNGTKPPKSRSTRIVRESGKK